jgi:hypothetical protein
MRRIEMKNEELKMRNEKVNTVPIAAYVFACSLQLEAYSLQPTPMKTKT